jgi:hypothetical protein
VYPTEDTVPACALLSQTETSGPCEIERRALRQTKTAMSEADISMRTTGEAVGMPILAPSKAPAQNALIATTVAATPAVSALQRVFSFPAMLATFLVGAVFVAGRAFSVDPDLWWHIRTGEIILRTHHWPTTDPYSFTVAGQPWIACEWLGDVLFATVARFTGLQGLDALLIVLGSAIMLALYAYATLRSGNSKAGLVVAAVLFVLANASFSLRPQMLGYLFLILTLIVLERFRQGKPGSLWLLPPLFLAWVNTHGSFVIGMGAIAAYLLGGLFEFRLGNIEARRWTPAERLRLETISLSCLIALTVTPYGAQLALYPFHVASSLPIGVANVMEWQSMPFHLPGGKLFLALVLAFFVTQMALRLTFRLEELVLLLGGIVMACVHIRFLLVFVPFFAPVLATVVARWVTPYQRSKDRYILNAVLMAAVIVAMVRYFPTRDALQQTLSEHFPVRAVEYLRQHPIPGLMFNNYDFGGYLVGANQKVFVDGRADPYERGGVLADYFHITRLQPGALAVLRNYGIQSCLLEPDEPLATMLAALPEWQRVYSDKVSTLFVRRNATASLEAMPMHAAPSQKE